MTTRIRFVRAAAVMASVVAMASAVAVAVTHAQAPVSGNPPTSFRVQVIGQGRPMILIPGLASDHDTIKQWGLGSDPRTAADAMADLMSIDIREDAAKIASPTLVLGTWTGLHEQLKKYGIALSRADVLATFEQQFAKRPKLHFAMADTARHFINEFGGDRPAVVARSTGADYAVGGFH